jgi:hypothetical protein
MKRLFITLVILAGLLGGAGAAWVSDFDGGSANGKGRIVYVNIERIYMSKYSKMKKRIIESSTIENGRKYPDDSQSS